MKLPPVLSFTVAALALVFPALAPAQQNNEPSGDHPWMDASLSPDQRADMVLKAMTLDEKMRLLHGNGMPMDEKKSGLDRLEGNGSVGYALDVPRLGLPAILMSDAAYGVRGTAQSGRYSTALPSNLGSAASWDPQAACDYGTVIGQELRFMGFNMTLGGGVDLTREPRNGRTFEYMGEDPVLAGTMVGNRIFCEGKQHVISDIKHYAINDQESGRTLVNAIIGKRAMRESDLLAFQIGIAVGNPKAVMCAYNAVNGDYSCENSYLLTDVLKRDLKFPGFVISDWGATHSTIKASAAGLDMEQPDAKYYGETLQQDVQSGRVPMAQLDDHVRRILRSEFASGIVDDPPKMGVVDVEGDLAISQRIAEGSIVLLKNSDHILPLDKTSVHSIAILGPHADSGMISGGGSAQVSAPGRATTPWKAKVWFPTSPMKAIAALAPGAQVRFNAGSDPAAAATLAKQSDVAIVFVYQWESEDMDLPNLSLPDNQDQLIEAVAAANPHTIVVLESGTAVTMPWAGKVDGIVEAWYAGSKGADAVARILFGEVNPSAKLPMTFPQSEADLPHPQLIAPPANGRALSEAMKTEEVKPVFSVNYDEGLKVGYKWYDAEHKPVLFPFGFGLSYTTFSYSGLKVAGAAPGENEARVTFSIKNTGSRAGSEIAEVYAALPASADEPPKRLVGWTKVHLDPGQQQEVSVAVNRLYLSIYDVPSDSFKIVPGQYTIMVGGSSQDLPLKGEIALK